MIIFTFTVRNKVSDANAVLKTATTIFPFYNDIFSFCLSSFCIPSFFIEIRTDLWIYFIQFIKSVNDKYNSK